MKRRVNTQRAYARGSFLAHKSARRARRAQAKKRARRLGKMAQMEIASRVLASCGPAYLVLILPQ